MSWALRLLKMERRLCQAACSVSQVSYAPGASAFTVVPMSAERTPVSASNEDRSGFIAGIAAFGTWGLIPVYWKLLRALPAYEILAHRFVWTTLFLFGLLSWQRRWPEVRDAARSRRALIYCLGSGVAISVNWFFFIWA